MGIRSLFSFIAISFFTLGMGPTGGDAGQGSSRSDFNPYDLYNTTKKTMESDKGSAKPAATTDKQSNNSLDNQNKAKKAKRKVSGYVPGSSSSSGAKKDKNRQVEFADQYIDDDVWVLPDKIPDYYEEKDYSSPEEMIKALDN